MNKYKEKKQITNKFNELIRNITNINNNKKRNHWKLEKVTTTEKSKAINRKILSVNSRSNR
jgi:hypothetical protein